MKKTRIALAVAAGLLAVGVYGQATAAPTCTSTITFPTGIGTVPEAALAVPGVCVLASDKLFGNFNLTSLTGVGTTVDFNNVTIAGQDHHEIAFNGNYQVGGTYSLGFEVEVVGSPLTIVELDGDFTQTGTVGTSHLTKNSTPTGNPASGINETKVGATIQPGSVVSVTYAPGQTDLVISETLTVGGAVSSINDTVVQSGTLRAPEPASLALLGLGLSAMALVRRRKQS